MPCWLCRSHPLLARSFFLLSGSLLSLKGQSGIGYWFLHHTALAFPERFPCFAPSVSLISLNIPQCCTSGFSIYEENTVILQECYPLGLHCTSSYFRYLSGAQEQIGGGPDLGARRFPWWGLSGGARARIQISQRLTRFVGLCWGSMKSL